MQKHKSTEDVYLSSASKLRASLPKFVVFLGATFLVYMFGSVLLIPLGQGVFLGGIETSKLVNFIIIIALSALILTSFREIRDVATALAGFVTYYVGNGGSKIHPTRLQKLQTTFRSFAYVILVSIFFMLFRPVLYEVHPALPGIAVIIIALWAIIALYGVVMVMGGEIEEAANSFTERLEKQIRKRK